MAWEELALLVLIWAAMIGVALAHQLETWEATLWCMVLLTQSIPYAASVFTALIAVIPAGRRRPRPAARPSRRAELAVRGGVGD
jgi:uncharacterized BrkB/YihY/UPF0761 family membrane protein